MTGGKLLQYKSTDPGQTVEANRLILTYSEIAVLQVHTSTTAFFRDFTSPYNATTRSVYTKVDAGTNRSDTDLQLREQLPHSLKQREEDELDEADLRGRFGHFLSIHERRHRKSFKFLKVTLKMLR